MKIILQPNVLLIPYLKKIEIDFISTIYSRVFNDQDNEFDKNNLTILDGNTVNRNPTIDFEISNKNFLTDELNKNILLRYNPTLQNFLKMMIIILPKTIESKS